MTEIDAHARHYVDALREADEPTSDDRERVRGAVLAKIALAGGAITAATAATAEAATTSAAGATVAAVKSAGAGAFLAAQWKAGAVVVALGVAGTGTWLATQSTSTDSATPSQVAAPTEPAAQADRQPAAPAQQPTAADMAVDDLPLEPNARGAHGTAARSTPTKRGPALDQEVQLLGQAQQAMKQGDADRALRLLDQHASQHPSGVLSAERSGTRAIALCEAGKLTQGRAAARQFLAKQPKSPLASRVRAACLSGQAK